MPTIVRLLLFLVLIWLAGCTRWQHVRTLPPPEEGPVSLRAARLTPRQTGMMVVLRDVQVTADSVIGWREGAAGSAWQPSDGRTRVAVHRSQVLVFESRVGDAWRTAGAVVLAIVVAGAYAVWYVLSNVEV